MSPPDIYASTACVARRYPTLQTLLDDYAACEITQVEFGNCPPLKDFSSDVDLPKYRGRGLIHNYFPPPAQSFVLNLASQDPVILARSRDLCVAALHYSAALDAPFYSVHCGFLADFDAKSLGQSLIHHQAAPYESGYATFAESLQTLLEVAKRLGMRLLLEPNVVAQFNVVNDRNDLLMFASPREFTRLLSEISDPRLGVLLDVGHLKVTARTLRYTPQDFVAAVRARIGAIHLHDNDAVSDQHLPAIDLSVLEPARAVLEAGTPVVVEAAFTDAAALRMYIEWLREHILP